MLKCHATFNHALFTCISGRRSTLHCYPLTPFCLLNDFWQEIVSFVNFTWPQSNQLEYVLLGTEYTSYVTMKMNIRLSPTSTPTIAPISKSNIAGWVNDCELVNVQSPYWEATLQAKARVTFPFSLKPQQLSLKYLQYVQTFINLHNLFHLVYKLFTDLPSIMIDYGKVTF